MVPKVLLVDDEKNITDLYSQVLHSAGIECDWTNNPLKAMDLIRKEGHTIVVMDLMMPEMSGVELIREIKKYDGLIQVIVVTGHASINDLLECLRWGARDCFLKPIMDLDAFTNCIKETQKLLNRWHGLVGVMVRGELK